MIENFNETTFEADHYYELFRDGTVKDITDEIPFDVPEGWEWTRTKNITCKIGAGSTPTGGSSVYVTNGIKFIRSQNVYEDGLILDDVVYISEDINNKMLGSVVFPKDILLNITGGSIGRSALVPDEFDIANVNQHVLIVRMVDLDLRQFIHSVLISPYIQNLIFKKQVGSGRGGLSATTFSEFLFPIPSMQEQNRIIEQLNKSLSLISTITVCKDEVDSIINLSRNKILDLAIRGKLVPQDPADEPVSVLLDRIRAEKEGLIKQGKLKRDKKESIIYKGDDNCYYEKFEDYNENNITKEIPFSIPDNWTWCKLSDISTIVMGTSPKGTSISTNINKTEFHQGKIFFSDKYLLQGNQYTSEITKMAYKNSILLCVRAPVGEVNITPRDICIGRGLASISPLGKITSDFIFYWIKAFKQSLEAKATGTTFIAITTDVVKSVLIPIPPINEQLRIINAIKNYYSLIEIIQKNLC